MESSRVFDYSPTSPSQIEQLEAEIELLLQFQDPQSITSDSESGCDTVIPANYREAAAIAQESHQKYLQARQGKDVEKTVKSGKGFYAGVRRMFFGLVGNRK